MESYHKGRKIKICNDDGVIIAHADNATFDL